MRAAALITRFFVAAEILPRPLRTSETVAIEQSHSRATSVIEMGLEVTALSCL